jgi:hypothetical protein
MTLEAQREEEWQIRWRRALRAGIGVQVKPRNGDEPYGLELEPDEVEAILNAALPELDLVPRLHYDELMAKFTAAMGQVHPALSAVESDRDVALAYVEDVRAAAALTAETLKLAANALESAETMLNTISGEPNRS